MPGFVLARCADKQHRFKFVYYDSHGAASVRRLQRARRRLMHHDAWLQACNQRPALVEGAFLHFAASHTRMLLVNLFPLWPYHCLPLSALQAATSSCSPSHALQNSSTCFAGPHLSAHAPYLPRHTYLYRMKMQGLRFGAHIWAGCMSTWVRICTLSILCSQPLLFDCETTFVFSARMKRPSRVSRAPLRADEAVSYDSLRSRSRSGGRPSTTSGMCAHYCAATFSRIFAVKHSTHGACAAPQLNFECA